MDNDYILLILTILALILGIYVFMLVHSGRSFSGKYVLQHESDEHNNHGPEEGPDVEPETAVDNHPDDKKAGDDNGVPDNAQKDEMMAEKDRDENALEKKMS